MLRPAISNYSDPASFIGDMLQFRKQSEKHFSVLRMTKRLRRISPTLVSLMVQGKRRVSLDRIDELAKLLGLTAHEKQYFKDWVARCNGDTTAIENNAETTQNLERRKAVSSHLLSDWINVYVKDAFQLASVKKNPLELYRILAGVASQKRIDRALTFLLRAGFLRKNIDGKIVDDTPLHTVDQKIPDEKVRQFHKGALKLAIGAIDQYSSHERYANALVLALDREGYQELLGLVDEMSEKLQKFAEQKVDGKNLYQVIVNISPTGGVCE